MTGKAEPTSVHAGNHRTRDDKTEIYTGKKWIPYPASATELIDVAYAHEWGVDDGLPVKRDVNGNIFVRILIGRERGAIPGSNKTAPGVQFHVTWHLANESWVFGSVYAKTDLKPEWCAVKTLKAVRQWIVIHAVGIPSPYVNQ